MDSIVAGRMKQNEKPMKTETEIMGYIKKINECVTIANLELDKYSVKGSRKNNILFTFLISISELSETCVFLSENNRYSGIPILLRSMLETYIDFINLKNEDSYLNNIYFRNSKQAIKVLNLTIPTDETHEIEIESTKLSHQEVLSQIKSNNDNIKNESKFENRFVKSTLDKIYYNLYCVLCSETHSNLGSLYTRHYKNQQDSPYFFKRPSDNFLATYAIGYSSILIECHNNFSHQLEHTPTHLQQATEILDKTAIELDGFLHAQQTTTTSN